MNNTVRLGIMSENELWHYGVDRGRPRSDKCAPEVRGTLPK